VSGEEEKLGAQLPAETERHSRAAREVAFTLLFELQRGGGAPSQVLRRLETPGTEDPQLDPADRAFAKQLLTGFLERQVQVDQLLGEVIRGWSFSQMNQADLNVLRLAAYELCYLGTSLPLVVTVAQRIARRFGGSDSGRFVHGVLADLGRRLEEGKP
jgi:N utilization substance protein B